MLVAKAGVEDLIGGLAVGHDTVGAVAEAAPVPIGFTKTRRVLSGTVLLRIETEVDGWIDSGAGSPQSIHDVEWAELGRVVP